MTIAERARTCGIQVSGLYRQNNYIFKDIERKRQTQDYKRLEIVQGPRECLNREYALHMNGFHTQKLRSEAIANIKFDFCVAIMTNMLQSIKPK